MTERMMYGYTHAEWIAGAEARAQRDWDEFFKKEDAFDAVKNKEHWKDSIDAIIKEEDRAITETAINFFAGGGVMFYPAGEGKLRVTAPGYWANGF